MYRELSISRPGYALTDTLRYIMCIHDVEGYHPTPADTHLDTLLLFLAQLHDKDKDKDKDARQIQTDATLKFARIRAYPCCELCVSVRILAYPLACILA